MHNAPIRAKQRELNGMQKQIVSKQSQIPVGKWFIICDPLSWDVLGDEKGAIHWLLPREGNEFLIGDRDSLNGRFEDLTDEQGLLFLLFPTIN